MSCSEYTLACRTCCLNLKLNLCVQPQECVCAEANEDKQRECLVN